MKIGPVFAPIFKHHQKLIFDAERVGLATGRLLLAFGVRKHRRHRFKCVPLNTGKPPEYFTFQLFDRIKSHRRLPLAATNQTGVKRRLCRRSNDWARRLKAYSAAELTALRDDVASLSASVGELVRRQAAGTTCLDQTLAASKLKLEEKANEAVDHIKRVVLRMSVVAALAVAAAIFALLALITGLVALYVRLEPAYGVFQALNIVGGV